MQIAEALDPQGLCLVANASAKLQSGTQAVDAHRAKSTGYIRHAADVV